MSLIDQRIIIAAPIETVWKQIAEPSLMIKWNRAYKQIQVLSTKATGVNSRRRCVGENGKATIEEVTAWLDNIGYEYTIIDGPYQSFRGRFRIQGVPDGTLVNWTIDYQLRGLIAGIRDAIGYRSQLENKMTESLKQLRRVIETSGVKLDPSAHARYAMQSAPLSMTTRSHHALDPISVSDDDMPELPNAAPVLPSQAATMPSLKLPEAPTFDPKQTVIAASHSAPLPSASLSAAPSPLPVTPVSTPLPSALVSPPTATPVPTTTPPVTSDAERTSTKPRPPKGLHEAIEQAATAQPMPLSASALPVSALPASTLPPSVPMDAHKGDASKVTLPATRPLNEKALPPRSPDHLAPTVPVSLVAPPPAALPVVDTQTMSVPTPPSALPPAPPTIAPPVVPPIVPPLPPTLPERIPTAPIPIGSSPSLEVTPPSGTSITPTDESSKRATRDVSIWDVFGVERPSERTAKDLQAVVNSIRDRASSDPNSTEAQSTQPIALSDAPKFSFTGFLPSAQQAAKQAMIRKRKVEIKVRMVESRTHRHKVKVRVQAYDHHQ